MLKGYYLTWILVAVALFVLAAAPSFAAPPTP
jgi:hypothetical protein